MEKDKRTEKQCETKTDSSAERSVLPYYIGLDAGSASCGFCAADYTYRVCKAKGKRLWGVRLFNTAETAAERRTFRSMRRRYMRRQQRIDLLQEIFAESVSRIDPLFFRRMDESFFKEGDKRVVGKYSLFNDKGYTDREFYRDYHTIYHLRERLMSDASPHDVRLVYLACHHIIKHRGHFLLEGEIGNVGDIDIESLFGQLNDRIAALYERIGETEWSGVICGDFSELMRIADDISLSYRDRAAEVKRLCSVRKGDKFQETLIESMLGGKIKLYKLFGNEYKEDPIELHLQKGDYAESVRAHLSQELENDELAVCDALAAIYDWFVLRKLLKGKKSVSEAMIATYEKHRSDLKKLKECVHRYYDKELYDEIFNKCDPQQEKSASKNKTNKPAYWDNYAHYAGIARQKGRKVYAQKTTQQEFLTYLKKKLKDVLEDSERLASDGELRDIKREVEEGTFLPKIVSKDNAAIPYQLNAAELKRILSNAAQYLPWLNEKDADGRTASEKIVSIMEYRIPYYVGPINPAHSTQEGKGFAWIVKKSDEAIKPWNFDQVVDSQACMERFIDRLINRCTYLKRYRVISADSLLYQEYCVWSELNQLRVNGLPIKSDVKVRIFEELFRFKSGVTDKMLQQWLIVNGCYRKEELGKGSITGYQKENRFASSLGTYVNYRRIFGDRVEKERDLMERIVEIVAIYSDAKLRAEKLKSLGLRDPQIKAVSACGSGRWSRLSAELLTQLRVCGNDGEYKTVMELLRETSMTMMEILYSKEYPFEEAIAQSNEGYWENTGKVTYEDVEKLYCSPSVKRTIWQGLKVTEELCEAMGGAPEKIFVEFAREKQEKKRTDERKKALKNGYASALKSKDITEEDRGRLKDLNKKTDECSDEDLRNERLYLYYAQHGKCMYSGETINLDDIFQNNLYDVDHIYPRALTKDDSIHRNKVLVKRELNAIKKDIYPISSEIQRKMTPFWNYLKACGAISPEKYARLVRTQPLSEEELEDFVARQMVTTNQSVKELARLLKRQYPDSRIVYSKACNVSEFRKRYRKTSVNADKIDRLLPCRELVKLREVNDLHHAKDAYLNIVVGNVFDANFSQKRDYKNVIDEKGVAKEDYNLNRLYDRAVYQGSRKVWDRGDIERGVYRQYACNDCLVSRMQETKKGGFFDQLRVPARAGLFPIKKQEMGRYDPSVYGGYDNVCAAFFTAFRYRKGTKTVFRIDRFPTYLLKEYQADPSVLARYFASRGFSEVAIVRPMIRVGTLMEIDGIKYTLTGCGDPQLLFNHTMQLRLSEKYMADLKRILKDRARLGDKIEQLEPSPYLQDCTPKEIFLEILEQLKRNAALKLVASKFIGKEDLFDTFPYSKQCRVIATLLTIGRCNAAMGNLADYDNSGTFSKSGESRIRIPMILTGKRVKIIHQSVTGLYERVEVLNE